MYCKWCRAILHTEYVDTDNDHLKVIYKSGKYYHGGGQQERYFSESVLGRGRKRRYAREVNIDESELENEEDDLEEDEDDGASDKSIEWRKIE